MRHIRIIKLEASRLDLYIDLIQEAIELNKKIALSHDTTSRKQKEKG